MRIVSLFTYNYNASGVPSLYLTKNGGDMYGNIAFASQYGVRFNDANTRIYTNTDSPEDLIRRGRPQDLAFKSRRKGIIGSNLEMAANNLILLITVELD